MDPLWIANFALMKWIGYPSKNIVFALSENNEALLVVHLYVKWPPLKFNRGFYSYRPVRVSVNRYIAASRWRILAFSRARTV